jgi:protein-S-isoprenylcysteine O-methyltransferase Ste14
MDFDPFGWIEKWIPTRWLHPIIRVFILMILCLFLTLHIRHYDNYFLKPLWITEGFIYVMFLLIYLVRTDPKDRSRGFMEIVLPLIGSVLPFALLLSPPVYWIVQFPLRHYFIFYWMALASSFTVWGLWTLRKSFSITVEVRSLVLKGPYRWVRHPIYLGEILTAGAVMIWRFSAVNMFIWTVFVFIQMVRARLEERKLCTYFPEYYTCMKGKWFWKGQ